MGKYSKKFKSYWFPSSDNSKSDQEGTKVVEPVDESIFVAKTESSPLLSKSHKISQTVTEQSSSDASSNHNGNTDGKPQLQAQTSQSSFSYRVRAKKNHQTHKNKDKGHYKHKNNWKLKLTKILKFIGFVAALFLAIILVCGTHGIHRVFREPLVWSMLVMLTIVTLLLAWEESIHTIRHTLPQALTPVVDSILAEMGGLGFIGLLLHTSIMGGVLEPYIEHISEEFLGEGDILIETFEFLHEVFFQVGVGFFIVSGIAVGDVLLEIKRLGEISRLTLDSDGDGEVTLDELADALNVEALVVDSNNDGHIDDEEITEALRLSHRHTLWEMFTMTRAQVGAEVLVMRERLLRQFGLPETFEIERYFEHTFGHNLEEMVEMSPLTWLPLIPLLALTNGIDLHKSIISAASDNASEACGEFLSNQPVFVTIAVVQVISVVWSLFNFWKLAHIKSMLVPTLVRDKSPSGAAVLLPPRYLDPNLRQEFQSSPWWVRPIEKIISKNGEPGETPHEQLWGTVGKSGPEIYRNSIKFHTWLCVTVIVYLGSQVVMRDIRALWWNATLGASRDTVVAEMAIFGFFVVISVAQLALAPKTFLYYSYVTSIEELAKDWAMEAALQEIHMEQQHEQHGDLLHSPQSHNGKQRERH